MAKILILEAREPIDRLAPEFDYLSSLLRLQGERVFGEAELLEVEPSAPPRLAAHPAEYLLLVGAANVLLLASSLERMRAAVDAGSDYAAPRRLAEWGPPGDERIYTLRGFEEIEARFLAGAASGDGLRPHHLPVSLWRREVLDRYLAAHGSPWDDALDSRAAAGVAAGLCHEFIDYYAVARRDVLPLVPTGASEVLEVGCAKGATGALLQEELGCRVTGVELNPAAARVAAGRLHRVVPGDFLTVEIEGLFDLLLATELFEHVVDSEAFLTKARSLVRPGGTILLSVPNVGHYSLVEDLLAGRWDYLPIGLLCFTHVRFFTRRSLEDLLRRCGCGRFELIAQRTELPARIEDLAARRGSDRASLATHGFYVRIEV